MPGHQVVFATEQAAAVPAAPRLLTGALWLVRVQANGSILPGRGLLSQG
jgi:hypothetical protein